MTPRRLSALVLAAVVAVLGVADAAVAQAGRTYQLRHQVTGGAIAFDGLVLYYADAGGEAPVELHRTVAATGAALPDLAIPGLYGLRNVSYDPEGHALFVLALHPECVQGEFRSGCPFPAMFRVGLPDLTSQLLFELPGSELRHYAYDPGVDRFRMVDESAQDLWTIAPSGAASSCGIEGLRDGEAPLAVAGAGGGETYVRLTDERTVVRVAGCRVVQRMAHPAYGRLSYDAMACDTVTFDRPALWMRHSDGARELMSAVTVPRASCPLPSRLDPVEASDTAVGATVPVCATLTTPHHAVPVRGERVTFAADGRVFGSAVTDARGRACAPFAPGSGGTVWLKATAGRLPAYEPSFSEGVVNVSGGAPPARPDPGAGVRPDPPRGADPPGQPAGKPQSAPGSQGQTQPGTQPGTQIAPGTQGAPDVQVQAQAQAQLAPQPQPFAQPVLVPQSAAQPQLADRLAMSRYAPLPLGLATVAMGSVGWVLARREQPARCHS